MFIKLNIQAHEALKNYMHSDHAPLFDDTTRLIYDIIKTAETDEAFANEFDWYCADAFVKQTAEGYDDLVAFVSDIYAIPGDLRALLVRYDIIKEG